MSVDLFLRHRFGGFTLDAAFAVPEARVTALFGPSGAGKSTIVAALAGLLRPDEGRISLNGRMLLDTAAGLFVRPEARRVGVVFQDARLFPHMSVMANLRFGWRRAPVKAEQAQIDHAIALLGLDHLLERRPGALSGGEKGRVALGRALLSSPEMLLLDEPLAALDAARKAEILPYLERLRDEARMPMLYVSHSLDEVTRMADRVILLKQGKVTAEGTVFDLLGDLEFSAASGAPPYGAVFEVTVEGTDSGLTRLSFAGGTLVVGRLAREKGARLRVRIRAADVMLAREEPKAISANNVLAARVAAVHAGPDGEADVQLDCGGAKLVARITQASVKRLMLAEGTPVFAIVKSVTVDSRILPAPEV
ncbi:MAG: molybdenum ABC transporter ATP-binding protein [Pseudomonadota bacterium]|nr:molybdenum ABC transporter ATP-binding protein [Pseudomonadota bacterium]